MLDDLQVVALIPHAERGLHWVHQEELEEHVKDEDQIHPPIQEKEHIRRLLHRGARESGSAKPL